MKTIVTGGAGFIGFNLCLELEKLGWDILVIDDYSTGRRQNKIKTGKYIKSSIIDKKVVHDIFESFRPEVVFHLAALPRVSYSVLNPQKTAEVNINGTINILEAIRNNSPEARFVYSSSSSVYGQTSELPTSEHVSADPQSPYALQKAQSEDWCRIYFSVYGIETVSLRYFNVFGPHSMFGGAYSTVLSAWMYHLFVDSDYQPYLEGDGTQSRDFCYVANVIDANIKAATMKTSSWGEVFNIGQGQSHTLMECKELLEDISGKPLKLENRPTRIGDVKHTQASIKKAQEFFNYQPLDNFHEQVEIMANWYRNEYPK